MRKALDDHGDPVELQALDPDTRQQSKHLRHLRFDGVRMWSAKNLIKGSLFALSIYALIAIIESLQGLPDWAVIVIPLAAILTIVFLISREVTESDFRQRRTHALDASLCPACWYDLAESPIEPDGCCVCPECGAAWRLPENDHND